MTGPDKEVKEDKIKEIEEIGEITEITEKTEIEETKMKTVDHKIIQKIIEKVNIK